MGYTFTTSYIYKEKKHLGIMLFVSVLFLGGCSFGDLPNSASHPDVAQLGDTWTRDADGMVMAYIPAGEFEMGSEAGEPNEQPVHKVYLDAFWIDQTEVTNAMYAICANTGRCDPPPDRSYLDDPAYANHPVVYLDWNAAQDYCQLVGGRLPTEAEWEKAARGTDGRIYPWGDEEIDCDKVNYGGCLGDTTPVASYENGRSPYGLYDMAGNLWEWTADWYGTHYYENSPLKNPTGAESGMFRVLRGGSWHSGDWNARTTDRYLDDLDRLRNHIGFRCVRSVIE